MIDHQIRNLFFHKVYGSIVALVTPMKPRSMDSNCRKNDQSIYYEDPEIDYEAFKELIKFHIDQGTSGILIGGTTGESPSLTIQEYENLIQISNDILQKSQKKIHLICGFGTNSTSKTLQNTKLLKKYPIDAALVVVPYYNKPTQEGLFKHFEIVSKSLHPIPVILYNVPKRVGVSLSVDTIKRLISNIPNIVGIKEASGDIDRNKKLVEELPLNFSIFCGDDDLACESILLGFRGVISVTSNVAPHEMSLMCNSALTNDRNSAENIDRKLRDLHKNLFLESNPIPVKWLLAKLSIIPDSISRLPLTELNHIHRDSLVSAYKQLTT